MNPMLMKVIVVSVLVHVIAGFLAGVITIATHIIKEDTMFDEPPPVQEEQPPPEVKVQIKPQKAPPEQPLQKLKMKQVNNIAIADVDVDLPGMGDSFSVSAGLGGMGGGSLLGGARGVSGWECRISAFSDSKPARSVSCSWWMPTVEWWLTTRADCTATR